MDYISVAIGGAIGAVLRFMLTSWISFPLGTLTVNLIGAFLIGIAFIHLGPRMGAMALFVMVGVLGGFTTFSTFSLDVLKLYEAGQIASAVVYILASVGGTLLALGLGIYLARLVLT